MSQSTSLAHQSRGGAGTRRLAYTRAMATFNQDVVTTAACIEVLLADAKGSATEDSGWNGSQKLAGCEQVKPDRAKCPLITVNGDPGHFLASASGAWQNKPIALAKFGEMSLDYTPVLTGTIVCPADGRAEIHWDQIPDYWKSATSATAAACQECANGSQWGLPFLTVVLLAAMCYIVGGVLYNSKRNGAKIGVEALPHRAFWSEVLSLVRDGVAFAKTPQRRTNYSAIRKTPPIAEVAVGGGARGGGRSDASVERKKDKRDKGDSSGKKSSSGANKAQSAQRKERIEPNDPGQAALPSPTGEPGQKSAASGGGGRWVHVPT